MVKIKNKKIFIGSILLVLAFSMVTIASYLYLMNYTNFSEQALQLIQGKNQEVTKTVLCLFCGGLIFFGLFLISFSGRWLEMLIFLVIDSLEIFSGAVFLLGLFGPFKWYLKMILLISFFIIYYSTSIAKEQYKSFFEGIYKKKSRESKETKKPKMTKTRSKK